MKRAVALLGVGTVLIFSRLSIFSFLIFLLFIAGLGASRGKLLRRAFWTYLLFFCGVALLYEVAWILKIGLSSTWILLIMSAVCWEALFFKFQPSWRRLEANSSAWPGALMALIVCVFLCLPILRHPSATAIVRNSARTSDDINHIALIEADRVNEGYVYTSSGHSSGLVDAKLVGYPQGWHVNGALLESMLLRLFGDSTLSRLAFYLFYKILWVLLALFFVYEMIIVLAKYLKPASRNEPVIAGFAALLVGIFLIVPVWGYGFQNFIAVIGLTCAGVAIACRTVEFSRKEKATRLILLLSLIAFGVTATWVLPAAMLWLLTLLVVIRRQVSLICWIGLMLTAVFSAAQLYATEHGSRLGQTSALNLSGAVPPISILGLLAMSALAIILLRNSRAISRWWALILLGLSVLSPLVLAAYQQIKLGAPRYYSYKLAYLSAVIVVGLLAILISQYRLKRWSLVVYVATIALLPLVLGLDLRKSAYPLKDSAPISSNAASQILASSNSRKIGIIFGANPGDTYLSTKLRSSVYAFSSPKQQILLDRLGSQVAGH